MTNHRYHPPLTLRAEAYLRQRATAYAHPSPRPARTTGRHRMEEHVTTTTAGTPTALDFVPERYRALSWSLGATIAGALLFLLDAIATGRPLGGVEVAVVLVGVLTNLGVYWPGNPLAKFMAAVAGAMAHSIFAALTDRHVTTAELIVITLAFLGAMGVILRPNARVIEGEVVESPVATRVAPVSSPAPRVPTQRNTSY